jgi:hypothetical protein
MKTNSLILRVSEDKKIDFKVAILRQRVSMQKVFEAFIDALVKFDRGEKSLTIEKILKSARESCL